MKITTILLTGMTVLISGCLSVLPDPKPADVMYRFQPVDNIVPAASNARIIRIDRATASKAYNGQDIIVTSGPLRLAAASGARWAESLPNMVQKSLIDVMAQRENLIGVLPVSGARTDTRIHLTINHFEAVFDNGPDAAPEAVVSYSVTFSNASNRNLIGSFEVENTVRADAASVSSIVRAMDQANMAALNRVADWLENDGQS